MPLARVVSPGRLVLALACAFGIAAPCLAQANAPDDQGLALPSSERIRVQLWFLAGYGHDAAQSVRIGFENQGRIGYAIVRLSGRLTPRVQYVLEINPVDDTPPEPACGEAGFFYPNSPQTIGPGVRCEDDGNLRVDDYKYLSLDPIAQQGIVRQAYVDLEYGSFGAKFGRFILPIGFNWEEVGSLTAKDATHIQRINAEANFGLGLSWTLVRESRRVGMVEVGGVIGDGNRAHDYDYFYFVDPDVDTNSALTGFFSARLEPVHGFEARVSAKVGYTGSKVERLPNYFASKRYDRAVVLSARYRANPYAAVFGEFARYTWGPTRSSAELLGVDSEPIPKTGYNAGVDLSYPIGGGWRVGTTITREELSRDDSLVKWLAAEHLYGVAMGEKERATAARFYVDLNDLVTVGVYRTWLDNPYPWISGSEPVSGPGAFMGDGSDKWGFVVKAHVH